MDLLLLSVAIPLLTSLAQPCSGGQFFDQKGSPTPISQSLIDACPCITENILKNQYELLPKGQAHGSSVRGVSKEKEEGTGNGLTLRFHVP